MVVLLALAGCPSSTGKVDPHSTAADLCVDRAGEVFCDGANVVSCASDVPTTTACDASSVCDAGACVSCALTASVPYVAPGTTGIAVEIDPVPASPERLPRMRAIEIVGRGTITVTGPFEVLREDLTAATDVADETVLVRAIGPGAGAVTLAPLELCGGTPWALDLAAVEPSPIAGILLTGFPDFDVDHGLVSDGDHVDVRVDLATYPDRAGLPFEAVLVGHRTPEEWADDPALDGVVAEDGALFVASGGPDLVEDYDVVVDFGRDGRLDPGDLLDGLDVPAISVAADLAAPGPYTPASGEISASYWLTAMLYAPVEADQLDPMPLVVISHGNGHDYTWYDYLGEHLASYGYVVISHRNDTVPGPVTAAATTWENTEWFLAELPTLAGGLLDGEVDGSRIAWIGHSRGGEGVVIAYHQLVSGQVTPSSFGPEDVVLVSSIAPTVFEPPSTGNPHGVAYHLLAGSADGDVTGGVDSPVTQYFRLFQRSTGLRAVTYMQGADHNDFNCCGAEDGEWVPPGDRGPLIGRARAQQAAKSYYLALLEATFHGEDQLWDYLSRAPENFRPVGTEVIVASQLRRADGDRKLVVDDFQSNPDPALSSSGGAVVATVRDLVEGALDDDDSQLVADAPMNGMSQSDDDSEPARGVVFAWDDGDDAMLELALPSGEGDLSDDAWVSLRACQATRDPRTVENAGPLSFSVALVDEDGNESAIDHAAYGGLPPPYPRGGLGAGEGWSNEFQTVRVPVAAFARGRQLDLTRIVAIRLRFGAAWGTAAGRIGLDDVEILEGGVQ